jgi:hypothetical protein
MMSLRSLSGRGRSVPPGNDMDIQLIVVWAVFMLLSTIQIDFRVHSGKIKPRLCLRAGVGVSWISGRTIYSLLVLMERNVGEKCNNIVGGGRRCGWVGVGVI